jgi:hypothetical protein
MNHRPFKLIRSCAQSQMLLFAQQDFPLSWHERFSLRTHLLICKACTHTHANVRLLEGQLQRWRGYTDAK